MGGNENDCMGMRDWEKERSFPHSVYIERRQCCWFYDNGKHKQGGGRHMQ